MIKLRLKTTDGKGKAYFTLPEKVSEIKLRHFTEFETAHERKEKLFEQLKAGDLTFTDFQFEYIQAILDCVQAMDVGNTDEVAFGNLEKHMRKVYQDQNFDTDQSERTVLSIYSQIYKVIAQYHVKSNWSQDYSFSYKGNRYTIRGGYLDALTGKQRFYQHATAQVVEALDIMRHYEKHRQQDPKGNYLFTSILYLIACFALKEGESFPAKELEINKFISDRVTYFQDVNMEIGLDVLNFFLRTRKR